MRTSILKKELFKEKSSSYDAEISRFFTYISCVTVFFEFINLKQTFINYLHTDLYIPLLILLSMNKKFIKDT